MAKYLATFTDTLDEIEINGFVVMSDREVENYEHLASSITWNFVFNMGDDELEYNSGEDLLSRIEFREITTEESKTIKRLFNNEFGVFISESFLSEVIGDEDDDDFDEDEDDDYDSYDDNYDEDEDDNY
jgi:hypothetical protein